MTDATATFDPAATNKMRWGAVLAGVVIALILQLLLSLLGFGVGLTTVDPAGGDNPSASTVSIAAGGWWILSGVVASAVGGYVAGRSSGATQSTLGMLHGLTSWAVTILIVLYLLTTSIGALVGGAFNSVTSVVGNVGGAAATAVTAASPAAASIQDPLGKIEGAVRSASGGEDPSALRDRAVSAVRSALSSDPGQQEQAKKEAADALARAQNIPADQARQQIDQYQAEYTKTMEQTKEQAKQAAETARKTGSTGSLIAFLAMVLGAAAAAFAGSAGVKALRGW